MNIINFLNKLAHEIPGSISSNQAIQSQSLVIQNSINTNDSEFLKLLLSNKKYYSTETDVTLY
jgi:hypothetical protein